MSRLGKKPVNLVKEAKIFIEKDNVRLEGPKGKLSLPIPSGIKVEQKDNQLLIIKTGASKQDQANQGTIRAHLINMIEGVTVGHKKNLEIQGVGFRAQLQGTKLSLNLGLSHPVEYQVPKDVKITVPQPTEIKIEGADKAAVGQAAAEIRGFKTPEPYKGKGIRYAGEYVRRKQGKAVTK